MITIFSLKKFSPSNKKRKRAGIIRVLIFFFFVSKKAYFFPFWQVVPKLNLQQNAIQLHCYVVTETNLSFSQFSRLVIILKLLIILPFNERRYRISKTASPNHLTIMLRFNKWNTFSSFSLSWSNSSSTYRHAFVWLALSSFFSIFLSLPRSIFSFLFCILPSAPFGKVNDDYGEWSSLGGKKRNSGRF